MEPLPVARTSPAAERNKAPILAALQGLLPASGRLLEIAAGTRVRLGPGASLIARGRVTIRGSASHPVTAPPLLGQDNDAILGRRAEAAE